MMEGDFFDNNLLLVRLIALIILIAPGIILYSRINLHRKNISLLNNRALKAIGKVTNFVEIRGKYGRVVAHVVYYEYVVGGITYKGKANWGIPKFRKEFKGKELLFVDDDIDIAYLPEACKVSYPIEQLEHEEAGFTLVDRILIIAGFSPILIVLLFIIKN